MCVYVCTVHVLCLSIKVPSLHVYIAGQSMVKGWLHEICRKLMWGVIWLQVYGNTLWGWRYFKSCSICLHIGASLCLWLCMHICMCVSFLRAMLVWMAGRLCWCFDPEIHPVSLSLCFITSSLPVSVAKVRLLLFLILPTSNHFTLCCEWFQVSVCP